MTTGERRNLRLELDPDSEPIAGRMRDERGASREFAGWLGLAAVLGGFLRDRGARPRQDQREPEEMGHACD